MKRQDYLTWDTTFMGIAQLISFRSKDPNTRHGAVIINQENKIISVGYNGFPIGCNDDIFPWTSPEKYDYSVHAERNAIDNSQTSNLKNCKLYLWSERGYYPCSLCAAGIAQKKISEVIMAFAITTNTNTYNWEPTKKIFKANNIKIRILENNLLDIDNIIHQYQKISQNILKENLI